MDLQKVAYLLQQYQDDKITIDEQEELFSLLRSFENNEEILSWLENSYANTAPQPVNTRQWQLVLDNILQPNKVVSIYAGNTHWIKWMVAACILALLGIGGYFMFLNERTTGIEQQVATNTKDIDPPKETKAMIIISGGRRIPLDSIADGTLAMQGDVKLSKNEKGEIVYEVSSPTAHNSPLVYNTLTNPRGSNVVSLILADGTKVWLNSESSLQYPAAFAGNERKVEITGEAYFEVAHDRAMPFKVKKDETEVTVLGTHFNINAYGDEGEIKVTLLEGSVNVANNNLGVIIKPGEQAKISANNKPQIVRDVDLNAVMAWKNGKFSFNRAGITTVMKELARWYDLEVEYKGQPTKDLFGGDIQKDLPLSKVLDFLKKSQVHFEVHGKKVIVTP